jgi:hypothetical protein
MLPLPAHLVAHITNLRSTRLAASVPSGLGPLWAQGGARAPAKAGPRSLRIGFLVHKLSGLLGGLLHHLLAAPLAEQAGAATLAPSHRPTMVLFAWEHASLASDERDTGARAERRHLDGMDEIVGLRGLEVSKRGGRAAGCGGWWLRGVGASRVAALSMSVWRCGRKH